MYRVERTRLIGRDSEFRALTDILASSTAGPAVNATIEGPPGIGKTRLLEEIAKLAKRSGYTVTWKSGTARDGLSADPADEATPDFPPERAAPQLVIVDGIHDFPPQPANAIGRLLHAEPHGPEVRLISVREPHHGRTIERVLGGTSNFSRIAVSRLSVAAGIELAEEILHGRLDDGLAVMTEGAGGNPLIISALAHGLREERLLEVVDGRGRLRKRRIPQRVQQVARHWLDLLSESARHLVQVAAAAEGPFMIDEVAALCGETTASLLPALDEAMNVGLVSPVGEYLVVSHELIRRSVLDMHPPRVQRVLRQEFDTLRNQRGVTAAGRLGPRSRAPKAALEFPVNPAVTGPLAAAFGTLADRLVPALLLARDTRDEPMPPGEAEQLRAELALRLGSEGPQQADEAAGSIVALFAQDRRHVMEAAEAVLASHSERLGAPDALTAAVVLSNLSWVSGRLSEGLYWGEHAAAAVTANTPSFLQPYPALALAAKLSDIGRVEAAEQLLSQTDEMISRLGEGRHRAAALIVRARLLLQSGRLRVARDTAQAGVAIATAEGCGWVLPIGQAVLILTAVRCGNLRAAADYVWRYRTIMETDSSMFPSVCYSWAEFIVASANLSAKRTVELLTTQYSALINQEDLYVAEAGAAPWFTRLALAANDAPLAASAVAMVERLAAANPEHRSVAVSARHARGLLERDAEWLRWAAREHVNPCSGALADEDLGDLLSTQAADHGALAVESLRRALDRFELIGAEGDAERVRGRLAELGTCRRDPRPAARQLVVPEPVAAEPAISPPASVRSAVPQAARHPSATSTVTFTETEEVIAQLATQGLTNRQIARKVSLSPHTVNYHLRTIFRKLDIRSRAEIARYITLSD